MTLHSVTEQQVADAAAETWHDYQDWHAVAREMLKMLGDTDAHHRIDGLRDTVKGEAIEISRLTRQVHELLDANDHLTQALANLMAAVAPFIEQEGATK